MNRSETSEAKHADTSLQYKELIEQRVAQQCPRGAVITLIDPQDSITCSFGQRSDDTANVLRNE